MSRYLYPMQRELFLTTDGSHTVHLPGTDIYYHSIHGALQESLHIYIQQGLKHWTDQHTDRKTIKIFEMGFGTGLNALLTLHAMNDLGLHVLYHAIETEVLPPDVVLRLNYPDLLGRDAWFSIFSQIHTAPWNVETEITAHFHLTKWQGSLHSFVSKEKFDLVYFDAFAPDAQPELWSEAVFHNLFELMNIGAVLTTYCSKGTARRALQTAGFAVEKLAGPKGKREILRATKN